MPHHPSLQECLLEHVPAGHGVHELAGFLDQRADDERVFRPAVIRSNEDAVPGGAGWGVIFEAAIFIAFHAVLTPENRPDDMLRTWRQKTPVAGRNEAIG